jgi:hypothetical protein
MRVAAIYRVQAINQQTLICSHRAVQARNFPLELYRNVQHFIASLAMSMGGRDKDIHSYGPCLRPYDWYGGGNGQGAHRSRSCELQ